MTSSPQRDVSGSDICHFSAEAFKKLVGLPQALFLFPLVETKNFEAQADGWTTKWKVPGSLINMQKKATCHPETLVWVI